MFRRAVHAKLVFPTPGTLTTSVQFSTKKMTSSMLSFSSWTAGSGRFSSPQVVLVGSVSQQNRAMTTRQGGPKQNSFPRFTGGAGVSSARFSSTMAPSLPPLDTAAAPLLLSPVKNKYVSGWLFFCAAWVSGVILVGALTRLTESGLSITEWKPGMSGVKPPTTDAEWEHEFGLWRASVEGQQRSDLTLKEFKMIFFWEWFHRVLARGIGVVFATPAIYFAARGYYKGQTQFKMALGGLFFLGGCQGALGWYMVKSGLDKSLLDARQKATVSAYRLASHLSVAFTIFSSMLTLAFLMRTPALPVAATSAPGAITFRRATYATTALMFSTAMSGAFVAGLDAGLLYNDTFPWMGEGIIPPWEDLTYIEPLYKNIFENRSASQLWHRLMAGTTTLAIIGLNIAGRRSGQIQAYPHLRRGMRIVNSILVAQVLLGFATLLTYVHTHTAATHQFGALSLLASLVYMSVLLSPRGRIVL